MSVTIKDIAKIANVSHTTVSRALNNSPFIKEETKVKIKELARQLNYVPNYSARSLVLNRSYNIAIFFSTIGKGTSPGFFHETIDGVNSVIKENYNFVIRGIDDCRDFMIIDKKRFDGIILVSQSDTDDAFIYNILNKKIPMVVLNREIKEKSVTNILSADRSGAFDAVNFLIENGHKDIALIEGKRSFHSTVDRRDGYLKALIGNNININKNYIVEGEYDIESGHQAMEQLLSLPEIPTAVFCSNDDMAVGAMKAIFERGLRVPDDISVIGFDDSIVCEYVTPALTTVRKPTREISIKGAERLLNIIDGKKYSNEKLYIKTELVVRESVKKLI